MRTIPESLQAALDCGATTMARCWKVTRRDGGVLGFTDHDRTLAFDGVVFEPDTGFTPSAIETGTGLAADTHSVEGVLRSDRITETDIARGFYSGAEIALYLVDWRDIASRVLLSRGQIGEIRRGDVAFEAEVTGFADRLSQPVGNAYLASCPCRLGDAKCGIDLGAPENLGIATVTAAADPRQIGAAGLGGFTEGWFSGGLLTWTSGANAGLEGHVKAHLVIGSEALIELWLAPEMPVAPGDEFEVAAGCDKTAATCGQKFGNIESFRGFPHLPGDDVVAGYPATGGGHNGGSLFRT